MKRFDPISWNQNGPGWSWRSDCIKECSDGDYVKFEDFEEMRKALAAAEPHMRHGLNCPARIGEGHSCACGMEPAWKAVKANLSNRC